MDGALDSVTRPYSFVTVRTGRRAISVGNARLRDGASTAVNVTVGRRSREYLTDREVERLIEATKQNRSGHRDATAILVAYRHGLRASELVALRWDHIDLPCTEGQERGCQCASDTGAGKPRAAQAPARTSIHTNE